MTIELTAQELYEAAHRQKTTGLGAAAMARLRRDYSEPPAPRRTQSWYEWLTGSAPPDAEPEPEAGEEAGPRLASMAGGL